MPAYKESTSVKYQRSYCHNDIKFNRHFPFLVNPSIMALGQGFKFWFCKYIDQQAVFGLWPIPIGFGFANKFICS
jgi:hypothetical protein